MLKCVFCKHKKICDIDFGTHDKDNTRSLIQLAKERDAYKEELEKANSQITFLSEKVLILQNIIDNA